MCDHSYQKRESWEGDPNVINGTNTIVYFVCTKCGDETYEPDGFEVEEPECDEPERDE